jgi:hypothetical protein
LVLLEWEEGCAPSRPATPGSLGQLQVASDEQVTAERKEAVSSKQKAAGGSGLGKNNG